MKRGSGRRRRAYGGQNSKLCIFLFVLCELVSLSATISCPSCLWNLKDLIRHRLLHLLLLLTLLLTMDTVSSTLFPIPIPNPNPTIPKPRSRSPLFLILAPPYPVPPPIQVFFPLLYNLICCS